MISIPITWVYEPPELPPGPDSVRPEYYARFIEELGRHAGVTIPLVQGLLRDVAPAEGLIVLNPSAHPKLVLDACAPEMRAQLASRLVPISGSRIRIFESLLEPLSVPAAVDAMTLLEWKTEDPATPGARGPYGLRDIGHLVGASCLEFESARYCYLSSPTHHGLPHLLADYLAAYARTVLT